jgi:hypothetical protein
VARSVFGCCDPISAKRHRPLLVLGQVIGE